jgi:hypothetical protein
MAPGTWKAIGANTLADLDPENDPALNTRHPQTSLWHGNSVRAA